ncbi:MAG TPA: tetratricopeptide repeat protein [Kofleriaceae bacterium]|nr:tetratricopeptide repeat protein [Kofleriaceae bacterium]
MREVLEEIQALLARGEIDAAIARCDAQLPHAPAAHALGMATIALFRGDGEALHHHATRAFEAKAGVVAYKYLAISHVLRGDSTAAIDVAQQAILQDDTPQTRAELGAILLAASRPHDALAVLRQAVFEQPSNHDARLHLAAASVQIGDHTEAIAHYAQAFVAAPGDHRPIRSLIAMFADLGKWLGAGAALQLARSPDAPPAEALVLDLVFAHIGRLISGTFPAAGLNPMADRAIQSLEATAAPFAPAVRLVVAHTFVDLARIDAARRMLAAIEPSSDDERAAHAIVEAAIAEAEGDTGRAIDCYVAAQAASAERVDASVKAIALLLRDPGPAARRRIEAVLAAAPAERRAIDSELMVQEAAYLVEAGKRDEARALVDRILRITRGAGPVAAHARSLLEPAPHAGGAPGTAAAFAS